MQEIFGHQSQRDHLRSLIAHNAFKGTFLFTGPESVGKSLVAQEFARLIFCANPTDDCSTCAECSLYRAGNHPDSYNADISDKNSGKAESLREMLRSLSLCPYRGGNRVVILNNCEHLSTTAANILLKTLEEPLQNTTFILIAANVTRLPRTVLSRCQKLIFGPLQLKELTQLQNVLVRDQPPVPSSLLTLADGTAHSLKLLIDHQGAVEHLLKKLLAIAQSSEVDALTTAAEIAVDKDSLLTNLSLMRLIARSKMHDSEEPEKQQQWAQFLLNILSAQRAIIDRNAHSATVLAALLTTLLPQSSMDTHNQSAMVLAEFMA
jgi:DNA polymerase III subunit delta'